MRVALAGTFGPIHDGHRALFRTALEPGTDGVAVGITSDDLAEETRKKPRPIPPYEEREAAVRETLADLDEWGRDWEVQRLTDPIGPAATDPSIDALVTSPETCGEIAAINRRRVAEESTRSKASSSHTSARRTASVSPQHASFAAISTNTAIRRPDGRCGRAGGRHAV